MQNEEIFSYRHEALMEEKRCRMVRYFFSTLFVAGFLFVSLSVQADNYPTTSYELSSDGKTLVKWHGEESVIDMSVDPAFNNVTAIGDEAFAYNGTFAYIKLPANVTDIGISAFNLSTSLETVVLPKTIINIGEKAFRKCSRLKSINIPRGVITLGKNCFENCEGLTDVTIPNSVEHFGSYAFADCSGLKSVILEDGIAELGFAAFLYCTSLSSIEVPEGICEIPAYAFKNCTSLMTILLPSTLTAIGENAFAFGEKIESVTCRAVEVPNAGDGAWQEIRNDAVLYVPFESVEAYLYDNHWRVFRNILPIGTTSDEEIAWFMLTSDNRKIPMERVNMLVAADDDVNFSVLDSEGNIIADQVKWARFVQIDRSTGIEPVVFNEKTNLLKSQVGDKLMLIGAKQDIIIYNVSGIQVLHVKPSAEETVVDVGHLTTGTYVVTCGNMSFKFMKK